MLYPPATFKYESDKVFSSPYIPAAPLPPAKPASVAAIASPALPVENNLDASGIPFKMLVYTPALKNVPAAKPIFLITPSHKKLPVIQ